MAVCWDCIEKLEDEALLGEFEQLIGWKLPESYKEFVKQNNSCKPYEPTFFETVDGERFELCNFYDFNKGSVISVWDFYDFPEEDRKWFKEQYGGELNDYIAFADDPAGNSICFNKQNGEVTFYDRENDKMSVIAENFDAFLNALFVSEN